MSNAEPDEPCALWQESLALRSAGVLSPEERLALEQHLANCGACSTRAGEYDGLVQELRGLVPEAADRPVLARLSQGTAWEVRPAARAASRHRLLRSAGLAAALMLLAAIAWWGSGTDRPQSGDFGAAYTTTTDVRPAIPATVPQTPDPSSVPTWGELSLSLARSDDALNDLLASAPSGSATTATHPVLTPRSLPEDL